MSDEDKNAVDSTDAKEPVGEAVAQDDTHKKTKPRRNWKSFGLNAALGGTLVAASVASKVKDYKKIEQQKQTIGSLENQLKATKSIADDSGLRIHDIEADGIKIDSITIGDGEVHLHSKEFKQPLVYDDTVANYISLPAHDMDLEIAGKFNRIIFTNLVFNNTQPTVNINISDNVSGEIGKIKYDDFTLNITNDLSHEEYQAALDEFQRTYRNKLIQEVYAPDGKIVVKGVAIDNVLDNMEKISLTVEGSPAKFADDIMQVKLQVDSEDLTEAKEKYQQELKLRPVNENQWMDRVRGSDNHIRIMH